MKTKEDNLLIELPHLSFSRSKTCCDSVLDNIEFSVSAKTSKECLNQFKKMLSLLEAHSEKEIGLSDKKEMIKNETTG